jgi:hypothetical protein
MTKAFCHLCKDGGKQCIEVNEQREAAMLKFSVKCSVCGRSLVN